MSSPPQGSSLASPVQAAAVTGDKTTLLKLIASSPEVIDQEDQLGRTPLMYSVLGDRRSCAEALLKHGAQVNHPDRSGRTALHLAAQTGNHRLLKLLLSRKADCTHRDLRDITAVHLSTRHQDTRCLALILKYTPPGQVDAQDQRKQTALHWSAYYNRPRHVRLLVRHGSNIGIPDTEGKIPLHWAAGHKDPEAALTVRCLLEAAPTESLLNWQDYEGRTPLHLAVGDGNQEVVRLLTSYRGCNVAPYDNLFRTPLHWAALLGYTPIAHLLLETNNSPNIPSDSQGATPLHYAAQGNCPDTVRVLLSHISVRDEADLEGRTAFMWAAGKGSDEVVRTMLELDPELEVNRTDKYGGTALHAASLSGQITTVRILLENRVQVDAVDVMKHTALFRACEMGHREVISTLIKGGAKVHLVDKDGRSPLHWAALGGNANVCQILIENNINPDAQDYEGRTPLQCAAYGGYIGCMEVLMENKADPNIQDKNGRTALHWSCNNGYLDAVKLLLGYSAFPNQMENTEERYTPLDYALLGGHQEVIQFMLEHGALSIAAIQDIAASKIQAVYKGHKVRRAFQERKNLLMKHEQLRKGAAAKKREGENRQKGKVGQTEGKQKDENHVMRQDKSNEHIQNEVMREWYGEETGRAEDRKEEHQEENQNIEPKQLKHSKHMEQNSKSIAKNQKRAGHIQSSPIEHVHTNSIQTRMSPSRTSISHSSPLGNETPKNMYWDDNPTQNNTQPRRTSRPQIESPNIIVHRIEDLVQKESRRKSHREERKGSHRQRASSHHRLQASERETAGSVIHGEVEFKKKETKKGRRTAAGTSKIRASGEAGRLSQSEKEFSSTGIQGRVDCITSPESCETPSRVCRERKMISAKSGQRPLTETQSPEKACQGSSALKPSLTSHTKQTAIASKCLDSTPSYIGFGEAIKPLTPMGILREGSFSSKWQNIDIELIPLEARLQLVEKEKARKQLFQRKKHAATVIQKAWRTYCIRKSSRKTRHSHLRNNPRAMV
ncbi:inversin-A [Xenopus laevis]|uniref:Inversin-A n=1 Tax=Xenopus laevis TaxID=8355 RepID=INVSA_XENLA|nr:inversin-A [Xenopus laevis]Q71S22.1 RecName: Full=Inversin-A [Xenopus laevis]AAQ14847.1 inv1 [Xenopus laevis]